MNNSTQAMDFIKKLITGLDANYRPLLTILDWFPVRFELSPTKPYMWFLLLISANDNVKI